MLGIPAVLIACLMCLLALLAVPVSSSAVQYGPARSATVTHARHLTFVKMLRPDAVGSALDRLANEPILDSFDSLLSFFKGNLH